MHQFRFVALLGVSLSALSGQIAHAQTASTVSAQESEAAPVADAATVADEGNEIVVTGTRTAGRTRLDSVSPVDVLSGASLQRQGTTELAAALATVAPSIDFPRPSANDGTDSIRPATLRGLSPDQTLVLVNGIQRTITALITSDFSSGVFGIASLITATTTSPI